MDKRVSWNKYFMLIAEQTKMRSSCLRRQVGCVIVRDKRILTTGYNGAPRGCTSCMDLEFCIRAELGIPSGQRHELCQAAHAEQNAILQGAYAGIALKGSTIYTTLQPCSHCAKDIIGAGITEVILQGSYPDELSLKLFKESGTRVLRYDILKDTTEVMFVDAPEANSGKFSDFGVQYNMSEPLDGGKDS